MPTEAELRSAAGQLRSIMKNLRSNEDADAAKIIAARDEVLARFQPVFSPENVQAITKEEFKDFLHFRNNRHWTGLDRGVSAITANMKRLKKALSILVDESRPIQDRLDQLRPRTGDPFCPKFGRATITAILLVAYPEKYGVLNGTSIAAMKLLNIWPQFERGTSFGERYVAVNEILLRLSGELNVDQWTLDALFWPVKTVPSPLEPEIETARVTPRPPLEIYLHEYLRDYWERTSLSQEWNLYEEDGELLGFKYNTGEVGEIDLLAHHKTEPKWLVVELKRDQSSDQTVGQVLRYMGWVKESLASPDETVHGIIICHLADKRIRYALKHTLNVSVRLYEVDFKLRQELPPNE